MSHDNLAGGCLCGNIKFVLKGKPIWIGYCHCASCRKATGAAAVTHVGVNPLELIFVEGELKLYESSTGVERGFCGQCGSPVSYASNRYDEYMQLYIGSFDAPEQLSPQAHVHCEDQIPWFNTDDELPRHAGTGDDGSGSWRNNT